MATHGARKGNVSCATTCSAVQVAVKNFSRRGCLLFELTGTLSTPAVLDFQDGLADAKRALRGDRRLKIASYGPIATCGAASRQITACSLCCTQIPKKKLARTLHLLEGQWLLLSKPGAGKLSSLQSMSSGIIQLQDSVSLESQPVPLGLAAASALISISDIAEAGLTMDPLN